MKIDEQRKLLIGGESVFVACGDEQCTTFLQRRGHSFDLEHSSALEDDVHLVELVWLLTVGLRCHEHVDADLESGRRVDDLVAAASPRQLAAGLVDVERVHRSHLSGRGHKFVRGWRAANRAGLGRREPRYLLVSGRLRTTACEAFAARQTHNRICGRVHLANPRAMLVT